MTATQAAKVRVKFQISMAGQHDPTPAELEAKYERMYKTLASTFIGDKRLSPHEIEKRVTDTRKSDAGCIRTGLTGDYGFKPGDTVFLTRAAAEAWAAAGIVEILPESAGH